METRQITVYEYGELSEKAREWARQDFAADIGFSWADDYMASLKALAAHFDCVLSDWSIDWFGCMPSSVTFDFGNFAPNLTRAEIAVALDTLGSYNPDTLNGLGECKLTGYCGDESAIDGFRKAFMRGETDLERLMQYAFASWLKAAQADCEDQYSDATFAENCEANNYRFYENGELA